MCGEHSRLPGLRLEWGGSSPHVRGTLRLRRSSRPLTGIIPACAGNTRHDACRSTRRRDHPRMCGEHLTGGRIFAAHSGSSPHVRGTRNARYPKTSGAGIIPACAGNTPNSLGPMRLCRDHPRMCGEHVSGWKTLAVGTGSSPHVRGTPPR